MGKSGSLDFWAQKCKKKKITKSFHYICPTFYIMTEIQKEARATIFLFFMTTNLGYLQRNAFRTFYGKKLAFFIFCFVTLFFQRVLM